MRFDEIASHGYGSQQKIKKIPFLEKSCIYSWDLRLDVSASVSLSLIYSII